MKPSIISEQNRSFMHLIHYQEIYLSILATIILFIPLWLRAGSPPGGLETYYLLLKFNIALPSLVVSLLPLMLGLISINLFQKLAPSIGLPRRFTFFFLLLLILSPAFIYTFSSLTSYSYYFLLIIIGFLLLTKARPFLSLIPFIFATFIDLFSTLLLISLQMIYFQQSKQRGKLLVLGTTLTFFLVHIIFKQPFIQGPFHLQNFAADFITDLGGLHGNGFFVILIAIIGLAVTWKKNNFYLAYFLIPLVLTGYIISTQVTFITTLLLTFFAVVGFIKLFERKWESYSLKKFTFLLLILGVTFSTASFLERSDIGPTPVDQEMTQWMKENILSDSIILTPPDKSYYVAYATGRESAYYPNRDLDKLLESFQAAYITELFPFLDERRVTHVYVTPELKKELSGRGLIFLLKNERFKLIHSYEEGEVWEFSDE